MKKLTLALLALCGSLLLFTSCWHTPAKPISDPNRFALKNKATVLIIADHAQCSGSIVNINGRALLLTARHCQSPRGTYDVVFYNGSERTFTDYHKGQRPYADWMLLQGDTQGVKPLELNRHPTASYALVTVASTVNWSTKAIVFFQPDKEYFSAYGRLIPGDSGSACIDENGLVVAVASRADGVLPRAELTSVADVN